MTLLPLATPSLDPADVQGPIERWAVWLLVGLSIAFSLVPDSFTMGTVGPEVTHTISEGSALRQIQFGSIFLASAWLAWRHAGLTVMRLRAVNPFLMLVLFYCGVSAFWSGYPDITIKRTAIFAGLMLTGLAISPPVSQAQQFLRVIMGTLTLLVGVSCIVAITIPSVGVDYFLGGAWRGITWQKNSLGSIAGFCLLLWVREWLIHPANRRWSTAALLLSLLVMVMAKSATAFLVTGIAIGIYLVSRRRLLGGRHTGQLVLLSLLVASLYAVLVFYIGSGRFPHVSDVLGIVTSLLNKSSDLTGRGDIWRLVERASELHPTWGFGYSGFWVGDGGPAQFIADQFGWMPSHAHNGFIDIQNELGEVGYILFMLLMFWHSVSLVRLFRIDREDAAMHSAIFVAIIVSNFSESSFLKDTSFQNIVFIYSSLAISARLAVDRAKIRARAAVAPPPAELVRKNSWSL